MGLQTRPIAPRGRPMSLSHLPAFVANAFLDLAHWLDRRSAARLPLLLVGVLFARGRRTVTSWFRAAPRAPPPPPPPASVAVCAAGRAPAHLPISAALAVAPLLGSRRLLLAIDDTPTPRWGPHVEGAGIPRNPSPGPAGERYVYGHVW